MKSSKWTRAGLGIVVLLSGLTVMSSPASAASTDGECPTGDTQKKRIVDVEYVVNGVSYTDKLSGHGEMNVPVTVKFNIDPDCTDPVEVTLVSYKTPSEDFKPSTADQHVVFDVDTAMFAPTVLGVTPKYSLTVNLPPCYFEVDFVQGGVIEKLGPAGSGNFYNAQGRYISGDTGGTVGCNTPPPAVGGTTVNNNSGGGPSGGSQVQGVQLNRPAVNPAVNPAVAGTTAVRGATLANTGTNSGSLTIAGLMLLALGALVLQSARRVTSAARNTV